MPGGGLGDGWADGTPLERFSDLKPRVLLGRAVAPSLVEQRLARIEELLERLVNEREDDARLRAMGLWLPGDS